MINLYRVEILEDRLKELSETVPGVQGAVIVSIEGFVVAAHPPADFSGYSDLAANTPQIAAMSATLMALGEQTLARLAQGKVERLLIEGDEGAMIVYPINRSAALATMVDKSAKMGLSLLAARRAAKFFSRILGEE